MGFNHRSPSETGDHHLQGRSLDSLHFDASTMDIDGVHIHQFHGFVNTPSRTPGHS